MSNVYNPILDSSRDESKILCKMFVSSRDESNIKGRIFMPFREELSQFGVVKGSYVTLTKSRVIRKIYNHRCLIQP